MSPRTSSGGPQRAIGLAALGLATAGGALLGWQAERRISDRADLAEDPEWLALQRPLPARRTRVVSADGTELAVEEMGAPGAPTLLLVHGVGLSQRAWHYQRRDLCDRYRVVTFDQRGHGASGDPPDGDWSLQALAGDIAAVLGACVAHGDPVILVGHSMGGMALLASLAEESGSVREHVDGLVLVSTAASDTILGGLLSTQRALLGVLLDKAVVTGSRALGGGAGLTGRLSASSSDLSSLITRGIGLSADAPAAHVALVQQLWLETPTAVVAGLAPALALVDLREAAERIDVPTLVLAGGADRVTPPQHARRLAQLIPGAELVEIPGVGHNAMLEAHAAVTEHLARFARRGLALRDRAS